MVTRFFALIILLVAAPALAGNIAIAPDVDRPSPPPPVHDGLNCVVSQGAVVDAQLGLANGQPDQGPCLEVSPPASANLAGFAFPLASCGAGFVKYTDVEFHIADAGDTWQLYLWRDLGGLPNDACGLECAVAAANPLTMQSDGPTWESYSWAAEGCPCEIASGERLWVGVVYVTLEGSIPDWYVGRQEEPGGYYDRGYGNEFGQHGAWFDLATLGGSAAFGNLWGVQYAVSTECNPTTSVPSAEEGIRESTWGMVRALYR